MGSCRSRVKRLDHLGEKLPFRHFILFEFRVAADVLHTDRHLQEVARLPDFRRRVISDAHGVRHRQQVVGVTPVHTAPAEVVGDHRRLKPVDQHPEARQVLGDVATNTPRRNRHLAGVRCARDVAAAGAALDVDVLFELWAAVEAVLIERNKLDWASQEFAATLAAQPKSAKVDKWRGMTGLHEVKDQRKLAIARELWTARENLAVKLDVSPGRLIPDSSIVNVVKETPKSKPQLAGNRSFVGRASRSYLDTWWKAIEDGSNSRDLPPLKVAATGIPNHRIWPTRFPEADRRLKIVRPMIAELAEKHGLPVENVLTPDYLRTLCFEPPLFEINAIASALRVLGAREWQIELTAQLIVDGFVASLEVAEPSTDLA